MAEARRAQVDVLLLRLVQGSPRGRAGEETHLWVWANEGAGRRKRWWSVTVAMRCSGAFAHHEVLKEAGAAVEAEVGAAGQVAGLLQEDGIGAVDLADINLDRLLAGFFASVRRPTGTGEERFEGRDARSSAR